MSFRHTLQYLFPLLLSIEQSLSRNVGLGLVLVVAIVVGASVVLAIVVGASVVLAIVVGVLAVVVLVVVGVSHPFSPGVHLALAA